MLFVRFDKMIKPFIGLLLFFLNHLFQHKFHKYLQIYIELVVHPVRILRYGLGKELCCITLIEPYLTNIGLKTKGDGFGKNIF